MARALPNVARANWTLAALWRSGLLRRPRLEAEALEARALRGAPPEAFGAATWWREPFGRLVDSLRGEARLNQFGEAVAQGYIIMALQARMRATALRRTHPEIFERPLAPPIVILGQMRSGTTRMQRLLACDPRLSHIRLAESLMPVPRWGRSLAASGGVALFRILNPEITRIHPSGSAMPEEEFGLINFSFGAALFEVTWRVPEFARWWEAADARPLYREFRSLLQIAGWSRGEPATMTRILKVPQFMQDLPALLETFPGARLIRLRRDPAAVVASSASLVWHQMRVQSNYADKAWIGREWLRKTRLRQERADAALAARPEVPLIDISFEDMDRDWRGQMKRIYGFLGLELTPAVASRMHAWHARQRGHLGHRYSLAQFGLSPDDVQWRR